MIESRGITLPAKTFRQHWQRFVQTQFWKMDIAPSAWIAETALIDRTWPRGVHIGENCMVDHHAVILTHDLTRGLYLNTVLEESCTIGARAIVLPGVRVGRGSVIAPGTVVIRDVPPFSSAAGNPACVEDLGPCGSIGEHVPV